MKGDNFSPNNRDAPITAGREEINLKKGVLGGTPFSRGAAPAPDKPKSSMLPKAQAPAATSKPQLNTGGAGAAATDIPRFPQKQRFRFEQKGGGDAPALTERQRKKLDKLHNKATKAENKYFKLDKKQPKRRVLKLTDKPPGGTRRVKLHFEVQTKAPKDKTLESPKNAVKTGAVSVGKSALTGAVDGGGKQSFDEKALRTGIAKGAGLVKDTALAPVKFHNWRTGRKYVQAEKAQNKAVKATVKSEYKKFHFEGMARHKSDPAKFAKPTGNPISTALQKKRFMAKYRKSLQKNSRKVGISALKKALGLLIKLLSQRLRQIGLIVVAIVLLLLVVGSCMQAVGISGTGIFKGIFSTSYPANDKELSDADWYFSDLETGLVDSIDKVEQNYPGHDEYRYFLNGVLSDKQSLINAVGHDPFAFLSFISVMHEDFTFSEIQGDLLDFFNVVYQIEFETETETRYRTVTDSSGTHSEAYTYYILNVRLTVADWETVIKPYIDSKDGERQYNEYINSGGNHQLFGTPFNFYWYGNISCLYGGRDNPTGANTGSTTASGQEMHTGLDIAVPAGTPIYSVMEGNVTFAGWHDLYGNYVDVTDKHGNKSRYAHCSRLLVSAGQDLKRGQAIAEVGSTGNSTGNHLHLEIFLDGKRVNPIFLVQYQPSNDESEES